ncbi:RNA polymerase sigma factor [Ancylomarina sp. 16SWW S1-10-2]|uniref:RNA polymerase sigma factor n=1 Tax=Ancylomarina sp. 16SWW S1-10-2 TaxID=2499681 RepID=UPI0012AD847B|nr:RNA polymerase sigma-70 factor [Ancylomarina sp. 16SWW S1-10-2]MRT94715.1 RNA polymerase sigma-70 factor [Ancylomarina sp. 16SWW S1-10-2]
MTQTNLFQKIKSGDTKAFEQLFNQLYPSMCVVARSYVNNEGEAEDIAQDAFIKLWNSRDKYDSIDSIKTYLYVLVKNQSLNFLRRNKSKDKFVDNLDKDDFSYFSNQIIEEETYRILKDGIDSLPPQSARIIRLNLKGLKNQEIAEQLEVSVNTVKTLKYNALKKLKVILKDYFFLLLLLLGEN